MVRILLHIFPEYLVTNVSGAFLSFFLLFFTSQLRTYILSLMSFEFRKENLIDIQEISYPFDVCFFTW